MSAALHGSHAGWSPTLVQAVVRWTDDFLQRGDFVDFQDLSVFPDVFQSKGWAPSAHAFGGVDIKLYRALFATMEGRYSYAHAKLGSDFVGFDPIDLSGFRISAGINVLY